MVRATSETKLVVTISILCPGVQEENVRPMMLPVSRGLMDVAPVTATTLRPEYLPIAHATIMVTCLMGVAHRATGDHRR
jgi:hypothetical protein